MNNVQRTTFAALVAMGFGTGAAAASSLTDFENFELGSIGSQHGWSGLSAEIDQEIVDVNGNRVWRISNAWTSGSFGAMPYSPGHGSYSGESGAQYHSSNPVIPANTNRFVLSFDFMSATGAAQAGLAMSISPVDGQYARQSYISITDTGSGFDLVFYDARDNDMGTNRNTVANATTVAAGLSYTDWHNVRLDITFVDGLLDDNGVYNGNDIVKVYVNDDLVHTGTTWESYFHTTTEGQTESTVRAIDRALFRVAGTAVPGLSGGGLYFDNINVAVPEPAALSLLGLGGLALLRRRRAIA